MGLIDLDVFNLTDEEKILHESAMKFAREVFRPASIELDRMTPEDVIAKDSVMWDAIRKYHEMGYHKMSFPEAFGGLEIGGLSPILLNEAMGWGSADLSICVGASSLPFVFAMLAPDNPAMQQLVRDYCNDDKGEMIGCWAITEPDHGSDWLVDPNDPSQEPKVAPKVRAVLDGDEYVINGQKAAWVSNGTIATHAALFVSLDPSKGLAGSGIAVISLDLPGITRGKPLEKMGQRALNQGEIYFSEVRIPKESMICSDPATYKFISDANLAGANAGMGTLFTGVAQAAYDEAVAYAKVRVQGGKPICEHQNIKLKLFKMFTLVEAARSISRRASLYNAQAMAAMAPPALHYSIASKCFCTEAAFTVASEAIQVFGGVGLTREYPIEKIFRDARASMIEDGVNETLALGGADWLID